MILNGKSKEDFSYKYNISNFNEYSEVLQNALIIEFFDSVGIYIEIECCVCDKDYGFESGIYFDNYKDYVNAIYFAPTRKAATTQAIKKANDIYNERTSL